MHDAIVIGAGHNGLVTAAYLARAGMRTLLVEARGIVGGTAASERFGGATVNVCNCDHLTFRTTPIADELGLADHGLVYDDMEPSGYAMSWDSARRGTAWASHHDLGATLDGLGRVLPGEVDGYRRYTTAAVPAARMILDAANEPPSIAGLTRRAWQRRFAGVSTILGWGRRSAANVLRSYFRSDAITGPATVGGPMVWGVSPELTGTGLGALPMAMKHVARVGRPRGGSGALPNAIRDAFVAAGGELRLATRVTGILCEGERVRGVELADGEVREASVVVSACDPHRTFLKWLRDPPPSASGLIERWSNAAAGEGFESKLDVIVSEPPVLRGIGAPTASTVTIAPGLADVHYGFGLMQKGRVLPRPAFLVNVPTVADPSLAPADAPHHHVLSVEVLYTPYSLAGGWAHSTEPQRWLDLLAEVCEPGLLDSIVEFRAMTPDRYEREFHLPAGHATSFAGGPLAVFRNRNPELTDYATAVDGLYLTGAATFPGAGIWGASGRNCATVVLDEGSRRNRTK